MRTAHPTVQAGSAERTSAPDTTSLRTALQNAAITIPQLLRQRAELHGDKLALREKEYGIWNRYSWSHYYETARSVALGLLSLGLKPGDRVAIAGEDTPEWFYADLGTQMIGAVAVGIYPTNPWVELQYIVRHSGARVVITGDQEQTDKVLDAIANNDGLPALRGHRLRRHEGPAALRPVATDVVRKALRTRQALRTRKPRRQCAGSTG